MATTYDLTLYAGESRVVEVTVVDEAGDAVNLTGASVLYEADFPTPLSKAVGTGIALTAPATGILQIEFLPVDTEDIQVLTRVAHECKTILSDGSVGVVFVGRLRVYDSLHDPVTP